MAQVVDDWTDVDAGLARLERRDAWRQIVAAIRRLVMSIRKDARFVRVEEPGFVLQGGVRVKEERILEVLLQFLAGDSQV